MSGFGKIKDFFNKRKLDYKFKKAGEGHRLSEESATVVTKVPGFNEYRPRVELSESASKAAEAALMREKMKNVKPVKQVKQNYDISQTVKEEKDKLKEAYEFRDRALIKEVQVEKPQQLAEVYFHRPDFLGKSEIGTYREIEKKIIDFFYLEKEGNLVQASSLIIYSENKDKDVVDGSVAVLKKLLSNLIDYPDELKVRRIRLNNEKIKQNIVNVSGAMDFLKGVGFQLKSLPTGPESEEEEEFLVIEEVDCKTERIQECLDVLNSSEPIKPILYRDSIVFHKNHMRVISEDNLSQDFFRISISEAKRLTEMKRQIVQESEMLLTKEMRENLRIKDKRKYRYALLRVVFPNNWILQGTFEVSTSLADVFVWIMDCLKVEEPFSLSVPPLIRRITDFEATLFSLDLIPCSSIRLTFDNNDINNCPNRDINLFLRDELIRRYK